MQAHIPYWMLVVIGAMLRFAVGGFGISLPHPYAIHICPRFWFVALPGCTVGLPVVLLGWAIRLTLGKGRADRFFDWVDDVLSTPQAKVLGKVLMRVIIGAIIVFLLFSLGYFIYTYGWWPVILSLLVIVGSAFGCIGVLVLISFVGDKLRAWNAARPKHEKPTEKKDEKPSTLVVASKKSWVALKTIFMAIIWLPRIVLFGVWQVLEFFGGRAWDFLKKRCPIAEIP